MSKSKQEKPQGRITLNEFTDHFLDILNAIKMGEVQGIAMAVVAVDSPTSQQFGGMWSTLSKDGVAALILRDTTMDLLNECEEDVRKQLMEELEE